MIYLLACFGNDQGQVVPRLTGGNFIQIHEHRNKRSLTVGGEQRLNLILDGLDSPLHFPADPHLCHLVYLVLIQRLPDCCQLLPDFLAILLAADIHKGGEVRKGNGLTTIGVGCDLSNDLRKKIFSVPIFRVDVLSQRLLIVARLSKL